MREVEPPALGQAAGGGGQARDLVRVGPEGAGAERGPVRGRVDQAAHALERGGGRDHAREPEQRPRRVVGVDRELDADGLRDRHGPLQKPPQVVPHPLGVDLGVGREQPAQLVRRVGVHPAREAPRGEGRLDGPQVALEVGQRARPVGQAAPKIRPRPVEHGHEVVAHDRRPGALERGADGLEGRRTSGRPGVRGRRPPA